MSSFYSVKRKQFGIAFISLKLRCFAQQLLSGHFQSDIILPVVSLWRFWMFGWYCVEWCFSMLLSYASLSRD